MQPEEPDHAQARTRLLKPSWLLRLVIAGCLLLVLLAGAAIFVSLKWTLVLVAFAGITPLILADPIAEIFAQRAERKRCQPGLWYVVDVKREQEHYGALRAHRFFGHPIDRGKKRGRSA